MSSYRRLLMDVGPLAMGYHTPGHQAGIHRVAERTLAGAEPDGLTVFASPSQELLGEAQARALAPEAARRWVRAFQLPERSSSHWAETVQRGRAGPRWAPDRLLPAIATRMLDLTVPRRALPAWDVILSIFDPLPAADQAPSRAQILTVHDLTTLTRPGFHLPVTIRTVARAFASLEHACNPWALCVSEHTRRQLVGLRGFPKHRTRVVHPGVDARFRRATAPEQAAVRERYRIGEAPFLLCLASMEPRKNLATALRAFARLRGRAAGRDLRLVLAGPGGWLQHGIRDELGRVGEAVQHIGFVDDADLPALLSACRAFVFLSWDEGFGLPVLEAMACGAAVLASSAGALPEVVGNAGLLADPGDGQAIDDGLERLCTSAGLCDDLGGRAALRAGTFTWGRWHEGLDDLQRTALAG